MLISTLKKNGFVLVILMLLSVEVSLGGYLTAGTSPSIVGFAPFLPVSIIGEPITFNMTVNQSVNVTWLKNESQVQFNETVTDASYTTQGLTPGMWNVSAVAENENGSVMNIWEWNVLESEPAPVLINWYNNKTKDASLNININVSETILFNATANQSIDTWNWLLNDINQNNSFDNFSYDFNQTGNYTVKVNATNSNGTSDTLIWNIEVPARHAQEAPSIIGFAPSSPVNNIVGESRTFNMTVNQSVNVTWYINGTEVLNQTNVTDSSYTNGSAATGTWNVTAVIENQNGTNMQAWDWNVELQKIIYAWNFSTDESWMPQNYSLLCCNELGNLFNVSTDYSNGSVRSGLSGNITANPYSFPNMVLQFWNSPNFTVNNTLSSAFLESDIKIANFTGAGTISNHFNWTVNRTFKIGNKTIEAAVPYQVCSIWRCSYGDDNITVEIDMNISSSYLVYLQRPDGSVSTIYPETQINGTSEWETKKADVQPLNFLQNGSYRLVLATMLIPSNTSGSKNIEVLWNNPNLTLVTAPPRLVQPEPPAIVSFSPQFYPRNETMPATRTFNITLNQPANVYWSLDGMMLKNDVGVDTSSFTGNVYGPVGKGAHIVTATASNWNGSAIPQWWAWYVATEAPPPAIYRWSFDSGVQAWTSNIPNVSVGNVSPSMEFKANDGQPSGSLSAMLSGNVTNNSFISPAMTWSSPDFFVNGTPSSAMFEFDIKIANFTGASPINYYYVILKGPDSSPVIIPGSNIHNIYPSTPINSTFDWKRINIPVMPSYFLQSGNYSIQLVSWLTTNTTNGSKNIEVLWDNPTLRLGDPLATVLEGNVFINGAAARDNSRVEARSGGVLRGKDEDGTTNGYYSLAVFYGNKTDIEFFVDGNKADQTWSSTEEDAGKDIYLDLNVSTPILNHPPDQTIVQDSTGNIIWNVTDKNPNKYRVLRNGAEVVAPADYANGTDINVPIDTTASGVWNYTIVANDTGGNKATDEVLITVKGKDNSGSGNNGGGGNGNSGNSGSGGGGGGGGIVSPENFSNIEIWEIREMDMRKDQPVLYKYTTQGMVIDGLVITSSINAGIVPVKVEQLRNTSTIVTFPPQGMVYKNVNVWAQLAPKYIENITIKFKMNNSWLADKNANPAQVAMLHWDGKWNELPTEQVDRDLNFTYYEAKATAFSPFAIVVKPVSRPEQVTITSLPVPAVSSTPYEVSSYPQKVMPFGYLEMLNVILGANWSSTSPDVLKVWSFAALFTMIIIYYRNRKS